MKKIGISVLILVACLFLFLLLCPVVNDLTAKKAMTRLENTPLPEKTEQLEGVYRAGKLVGCGNGMQFFGAILIESELAPEELEAYYAQYRQKEYEYIVETQTEQEIWAAGENLLIRFQTQMSGKNCYIVYSWADGVYPFLEFDLRGH